MNKYLVCHSHISVEPEAVGVDGVLSFTEMESVLNEDCILIVSDIVHASLTATYIKNIQKDPNCVYGLSGMWVDVTDKNIENCNTVVKFDRSFTGQRYTTLDYGNQPVHVFDKPSYALNPSKVKIRPVDNCYLFSSELEKAGIPRVVVDTKLWGGPRINMPRFTTFNFKASLFRSLASTEWKALPRPEDKEEDAEFEGIIPDPLEKKEYDFDGLPDVMVMMTTHNRTDTALATIESLVKHLKYPKLRWCICDDRSEKGHVARLADKFFELGVEDVKICRTNDERWGLGASINNGLRACFDVGPVAFTTEDDWLLTKDLDITKWVKFLVEDTKAGVIRLGVMWNRDTTKLSKYTDDLYENQIVRPGTVAWLINNQVGIRHRRLYDALGLYKENIEPDATEAEFNTRFVHNAYPSIKVFWPTELKTNVWKDQSLPFYHFGHSTIGHSWVHIDDSVKVESVPFFRIITPVYNTGNFLLRVYESLKNQTFKDFKWVIADDCSSDDSKSIIKELEDKCSWIQTVFLQKHVDAGGARNAAINTSNSKYTLYLDSDDILCDNNVLRNIYDTIMSNNNPDVVCLYYKQNGKVNTVSADSPEAFSKLNPAPWQYCHKTSISQKFVTNRRRHNDVVWFYRLCDHVKTIATCRHPYCEYMSDNTLSGQNGSVGRSDVRSYAADYYMLADLMSEEFSNKYVKDAANEFWTRKRKLLSDKLHL